MSPVWRATSHLRKGTPPALFLDRDGVLVRDADYLASADGVEILPGVTVALQQARAAGFLLIGVSNQSGLGRGYFGPAEFGAVMEEIDRRLESAGAGLDGFYYCPHAPDQECRCRKPLPGLLEEAAADAEWDRDRSWVIGDKLSDIQLGRDAGLGACLVRTGYGAEQEDQVRRRWPADPRVLFAEDLAAAVPLILAHSPENGA